MATTLQWITLILLTLILWLIIAPLCIWCLYKYYSYRDNIIIQKRCYGLTIIWTIFTTIYLTIERPLHLLGATLSMTDTPTAAAQIGFGFGLLLFQVFFYGSTWMLALKYWKIFYSIKWAKATMNGKWKMHLNHVELNKNWYLRNKNKYGSIHYMRYIAFVFWLIFSIISIFSIVVIRDRSPGMFVLIQMVVGLTPSLIIPICLYFPMRKFIDSFYIISEMKYLTVFSIVTMVIYLIINVMSNAGNISMYTRSLILTIFTIICGLVYIIVQTIVVLKNVSKMLNNISHNSDTKLLENIGSQSSKMFLSTNNKTSDVDIIYDEKDAQETDDSEIKKKKTIRLSDVLETECLFEKFASHLIREWSMELVLSFVEFSQFQQLIENDTISKNNLLKMMFTQIQQALLKNKSIPKSFVVYNDINEVMKAFDISGYEINDGNIDKIKEYKIRAYVLYLKYVQNSSDLEINISYSHKCELDSLMKQMNVFINNVNITEKELFELYNHVIEEVSQLLNYSFHRFVADGTYDELSLSK